MSYATRSVVVRVQNPDPNRFGTIEKAICPVIEKNAISSTGFIMKGVIAHRFNAVTGEDAMIDLDTRWAEVPEALALAVVEAAMANESTREVRMVSTSASGQVRVRNTQQPNENAQNAWINLTAVGSEPALLVQLTGDEAQAALAKTLGCDYEETVHSGQAGQFATTLTHPIAIMLDAACQLAGTLSFPKFERESQRPSRADQSNPLITELLAHFDQTGQLLERSVTQRTLVNSAFNERFQKAAQSQPRPSRFQTPSQAPAQAVPAPAVSAVSSFARYGVQES